MLKKINLESFSVLCVLLFLCILLMYVFKNEESTESLPHELIAKYLKETMQR